MWCVCSSPTFMENGIENADPWRGIMIGSDYDGIVDPFDCWHSISSYPNLRAHLIKYFSEERGIICVSTEEVIPYSVIHKMMSGKSIKSIINQIFFQNADQFLQKYFTDAYLK